ncbi:MAG: hypothetical protein E7408_04930 [Ruminococcaceae bacterium]|nr:hypothetical protein [Oscillospiraceae bacterium]
MSDRKTCILCDAEECLTTLGQLCLCTACRAQLLQDALAFAKRNTTRGTLYHAAFTYLWERFAEETEFESIKEA